jgi:hypothetical protein
VERNSLGLNILVPHNFFFFFPPVPGGCF